VGAGIRTWVQVFNLHRKWVQVFNLHKYHAGPGLTAGCKPAATLAEVGAGF
jgi:hypothetical protein